MPAFASQPPVFACSNRTACPWPDRELFVHCGRWAKGKRDDAKYEKCAVRFGRWRLVDHGHLYDIASDPGESTDVAGSYPDVVQELRDSYERWWASVLPLVVNEDLPRVAPDDQPLAIRYNQQLREQGIPDWAPPALEVPRTEPK